MIEQSKFPGERYTHLDEFFAHAIYPAFSMESGGVVSAIRAVEMMRNPTALSANDILTLLGKSNFLSTMYVDEWLKPNPNEIARQFAPLRESPFSSVHRKLIESSREAQRQLDYQLMRAMLSPYPSEDMLNSGRPPSRDELNELIAIAEKSGRISPNGKVITEVPPCRDTSELGNSLYKAGYDVLVNPAVIAVEERFAPKTRSVALLHVGSLLAAVEQVTFDAHASGHSLQDFKLDERDQRRWEERFGAQPPSIRELYSAAHTWLMSQPDVDLRVKYLPPAAQLAQFIS